MTSRTTHLTSTSEQEDRGSAEASTATRYHEPHSTHSVVHEHPQSRVTEIAPAGRTTAVGKGAVMPRHLSRCTGKVDFGAASRSRPSPGHPTLCARGTAAPCGKPLRGGRVPPPPPPLGTTRSLLTSCRSSTRCWTSRSAKITSVILLHRGAVSRRDSSGASRSANARPTLGPRTAASSACRACGGRVRRCARRIRACAMNPEN